MKSEEFAAATKKVHSSKLLSLDNKKKNTFSFCILLVY